MRRKICKKYNDRKEKTEGGSDTTVPLASFWCGWGVEGHENKPLKRRERRTRQLDYWVCFIFRTTMKGERISECSHEDSIVEMLLIGSMTDFKRCFLPDFYDWEESICRKLQESYNILVSLEEKINSNKSKGLLVILGKHCHLEEWFREAACMQECTFPLIQDVWEEAVRWLIEHYAFPNVSIIMQHIWITLFR